MIETREHYLKMSKEKTTHTSTNELVETSSMGIIYAFVRERKA